MKVWDLFKAALFISGIAIVVVWLNDEEWDRLGPEYQVVDGDSLKQGNLRIRLAGIDAPELDQRCIKDGKGQACGEQAKQHLASLLKSKEISCNNAGTDKHGRRLAVCQMDNVSKEKHAALVVAGIQASINAQMVHDGWALAYGDYKALEILAAISKRGIWNTSFEEPQEWRRKNGMN